MSDDDQTSAHVLAKSENRALGSGHWRLVSKKALAWKNVLRILKNDDDTLITRRAITSRRGRRRRRRLDARLERRPRAGDRRNREATVVERRRKSGDDRLATADDGRRR